MTHNPGPTMSNIDKYQFGIMSKIEDASTVWVWLITLVASALGRLRQEDC